MLSLSVTALTVWYRVLFLWGYGCENWDWDWGYSGVIFDLSSQNTSQRSGYHIFQQRRDRVKPYNSIRDVLYIICLNIKSRVPIQHFTKCDRFCSQASVHHSLKPCRIDILTNNLQTSVKMGTLWKCYPQYLCFAILLMNPVYKKDGQYFSSAVYRLC